MLVSSMVELETSYQGSPQEAVFQGLKLANYWRAQDALLPSFRLAEFGGWDQLSWTEI